MGLSAHERPPPGLMQLYKKLRSLKDSEVDSDPRVLDLQQLNDSALPEGLCLERRLDHYKLSAAFDQFLGCSSRRKSALDLKNGPPVYTHEAVPGLKVIPSLLPRDVQIELLSRLLHRDLSDPNHKTNIHLHHQVSYYDNNASVSPDQQQGTTRNPSFFEDDPSRMLYPKDPSVHAPLSIQTMLNRKLRWITLGGQYNWTDKTYPAEQPPDFPHDVGALLGRIFPDTNAEAAIVNVYSPGDTLSVHRDVSEECDSGLISISFGCEGIFMVSNGDESSCVVLRLRSGDAVYMAGASRFAWHAVPKILLSSCPDWLQDWPGCCSQVIGPDSAYKWRGWMSKKRVNLNVRQMKSERCT